MFNKTVSTKTRIVELPNKFKTTQYVSNKDFKISQKGQTNNFDIYKPKEDIVRILYKKARKSPKVRFIKNTIEEYERLVNGQIEIIPYNNLLLICNNRGKNLDLLPNVIFNYDYIAGDCFIIGNNCINGYFRSLTLEELSKAKTDLIHKSLKHNLNKTVRKINNEHGQIVK